MFGSLRQLVYYTLIGFETMASSHAKFLLLRGFLMLSWLLWGPCKKMKKKVTHVISIFRWKLKIYFFDSKHCLVHSLQISFFRARERGLIFFFLVLETLKSNLILTRHSFPKVKIKKNHTMRIFFKVSKKTHLMKRRILNFEENVILRLFYYIKNLLLLQLAFQSNQSSIWLSKLAKQPEGKKQQTNKYQCIKW